MGRQNVNVVVALVFMAVLGLAAAASSPSPSSSPSKSPAGSSTDVIVEPPTNDDQIGTTDDDNYLSPDDGEIAMPGPIGSASSYDNSAPSAGSSEPAADSGSNVLVVGVTSIAGALLSFLL